MGAGGKRGPGGSGMDPPPVPSLIPGTYGAMRGTPHGTEMNKKYSDIAFVSTF